VTLFIRAKSWIYPACPGLPWNRSEAQGPAVLCLSRSTLLTKVTALPLSSRAQPRDLQCAPAPGTKVSVPLVLPQNRHPERSASPIYRAIQRLVARSRRACPERSRRNLGGAYLPRAAWSFSTTEADNRICCGCYYRNRLSGFILRKCTSPFLIHRHSFVEGVRWHSVFHPSSWVVGLDDHWGCYCWNRLSGFILHKCTSPFLIHRHSFVGGVRVAFSFHPSSVGCRVR
jgi:hypothetical protein